jgi:hypothetical protein
VCGGWLSKKPFKKELAMHWLTFDPGQRRVLLLVINISRNRLLKFCCVPATGTSFLVFLLRLLTVPMKQTTQAVHAINQSIILRPYSQLFIFFETYALA